MQTEVTLPPKTIKKNSTILGGYREITFRGDVVEKRHKKFRTKKYGVLQVNYPIGPYIRLKLGTTDLNATNIRRKGTR